MISVTSAIVRDDSKLHSLAFCDLSLLPLARPLAIIKGMSACTRPAYFVHVRGLACMASTVLVMAAAPEATASPTSTR